MIPASRCLNRARWRVLALAAPLLLAACQPSAQPEPLSGDFHALRVVGDTLLYGEHGGVRTS